VELIATESGGRATPFVSGYRPDLDLGLGNMVNGCQIRVIDAEQLAPGESGIMEFILLVPDLQRGRLRPGFRFKINEGSRVIGTGKILEVYDPTLKKGS
jgi:translation elongation factor EF-Tu-like GTPase